MEAAGAAFRRARGDFPCCEPKERGACGSGLCSSGITPSFACIGYGPPGAGPARIIGRAPQAQAYFSLAAGVYGKMAIRGVLYWNSHVFNPTDGAGDDASCDSSPGAGDGFCDACPITGGESTQNEMFVLFGAHYVDPTVPGARSASE